MTDSVLLTEVAKAMPVVLGGVLAILGGVGSQVLVHRFTDQRERAKLRREKLESLVTAVYAHGQWIEEKQRRMVFRNEDHDVASPLDDARMLQALHFPELATDLLAVQQAQIPLLKFVNEQRIKHMKSQEAFVAEWNSTPFDEAYKQYLIAINALVKRARSLVYAE
jgi:hypothetical protein